MGFILGLLAVVAVLSSVLLMVVILLQEPKGGGIASALGGSGMEAIGVNTGEVNTFTSWVAGIWIVACFAHAVMMVPGASLDAVTDADNGDDAADVQDGGNAGSGGETPVEPPK